jgi:hypothetical protein
MEIGIQIQSVTASARSKANWRGPLIGGNGQI